jgi:inner membrane protein
MPTIISHPAVPLAIAGVGGKRIVSIRLLIAAALVSILPDIDVIGYKLGIPYSHWLGHRGFFHSIAFAFLIGFLGAWISSWFKKSRITVFLVLFLSTVSHGLLDAVTDGGLGIAFFSPISNHRYFFPWHPIAVSPLSIDRFLSGRGISVLRSELIWIWFPFLSIGILGIFTRRLLRWITIRSNRRSKEHAAAELKR